jgi:hypothetical protein
MRLTGRDKSAIRVMVAAVRAGDNALADRLWRALAQRVQRDGANRRTARAHAHYCLAVARRAARLRCRQRSRRILLPR